MSGETSTTISQALYEKDEETGDEPTPFANTAWFKSSQMTFGVGDASRAYFSFFFAVRVRGEKEFTGSYTEVNSVVATIFDSIIEKIGRSRKRSL